MSKSFPEILEEFPHKRFVSDEKVTPFHFYEKYLPHSNEIWLKFGYFSSNAIRTLSLSFARFIYKGGKATIITNHFYNEDDAKELIGEKSHTEFNDFDLIDDHLNSTESIKDLLDGEKQHFYNCLRYLQENNRLKIQPVRKKDGSMSHYKEGVFEDYDGNYIGFNGSCNFTYRALMVNGESLDIKVDWNDAIDSNEIQHKKNEINNIINNSNSKYVLLNKKDLEIVTKGQKKELDELLLDERELNNSISKSLDKDEIYEQILNEYKKEKDQPKFPYDNPYPYQVDAYNAWVQNNYKGLFAMATGTGKTLTSINCIINEWKKNNILKNIFVVPGKELVEQWSKELKQSKFKSVFEWYSSNNRLKSDVDMIRILKDTNYLNIVITYDSFISDKFQNIFRNELKDFIVVFDEVHELGAPKRKSIVSELIFNKVIGLSATPLRLWDDNDENLFIENLFNSYHPNYTFNYSMEKAIQNGFLCTYNYYPYFINLSDAEFDEYIELTAKIPLGEDLINSHAAIKRQSLLDNAIEKDNMFLNILTEMVENDNYKYTLVYCPKGTDDNTKERRIEKLLRITSKNFPHISSLSFLGESDLRKTRLNQFASGFTNMLFAIKCLDQGVDVPRTENAIFLASGKNYREFVQRRGRVLRKYSDKNYKKEHANIYDILVLPTMSQYTAERNTMKKLIFSEFNRFLEFYNLAMPNPKTYRKIQDKLTKYGFTIEYLQNELLTKSN